MQQLPPHRVGVRACLQDGDHRVQFNDFCMAMNRTMRGSMEQRLQFVFELFGEPDPGTKGGCLRSHVAVCHFQPPTLRRTNLRSVCHPLDLEQSCAWVSATWYVIAALPMLHGCPVDDPTLTRRW